MFMVSNGNVSELEDGIEEVIVTNTPEICRQVILNVRRSLQIYVQTGLSTHPSICVKSRIYAAGSEGHHLPFLLARCLHQCWQLRSEHTAGLSRKSCVFIGSFSCF